MLVATEGDVLNAFKAVHGEMTGSCFAEVLYGDRYEIVGVACMKGGEECWSTSLAEITFDLLVMRGVV